MTETEVMVIMGFDTVHTTHIRTIPHNKHPHPHTNSSYRVPVAQHECTQPNHPPRCPRFLPQQRLVCPDYTPQLQHTQPTRTRHEFPITGKLYACIWVIDVICIVEAGDELRDQSCACWGFLGECGAGLGGEEEEDVV